LNFEHAVLHRDMRCFVSGVDSSECTPCHIIPFVRTNEYIASLTRKRGQGEESVISNINDVRNGLLLGVTIHNAFRRGRIAFLKTPNFAMSTSDVPRVTTEGQESRPSDVDDSVPVRDRYTLHQFPALPWNSAFTSGPRQEIMPTRWSHSS